MKSRIIGKGQLLSLSLVLALGLSVYVNWYYTNQYTETEKPEATNTYNLGDAQLVNSSNTEISNDSYFADAKLNRTKAHDNLIKHLENIIADKNNDNETVTMAKNKLVNISEQIKLETDIENLIKAQLKNECVVTYDDDSIEVVMPEKTVNESSVIKIKDIILAKTSLESDKILIIELK